MAWRSLLLLLGAAAIARAQRPDGPQHDSGIMSIDVTTMGAKGFSYSVAMDGEVWLRSSPVRAYFEHTEHASPQRLGASVASRGSDEIGAFVATTQRWKGGGTEFSTAIKEYAALKDVAVFETRVPGGATGTNASSPVVPGGWPGNQGNVKPIVAFPAFSTAPEDVGNGTGPGLAALKLQNWKSNFCYSSHGQALRKDGNKTTSPLGQGMFGGPLVLHGAKNLTANASASLSTLVVAPLDHVKHHGSYRNDTISSPWELGVYSQVTSLPVNFSHRTLLVAGAGVTSTMAKYGELVRRLAKTDKSAAMAKDLVVNKLGYWTDSGAYYYADIPFKHNISAMAATYRPGATMEDVAVAVKASLDKSHVPIKYWQWDDWWYPGHPVYVYCVQDWSMLPEFFPSGLSGLYDKLKVPFLYYMPYWCMDNNTARTDQWQFITPQDCGWECQFTFVRGNQSEAFHTELFTKYKPLGMSNYEQDFMVTNFVKTNLYSTDLTEYPLWLEGLNAAGRKTEVAIQFCMAMPSDIMASVHLDWVTNARASDDYAGGTDNLINVPHASLLMWSLGMRPSKDNFWTSNVTDNPYQRPTDSHPRNPGSNVELNTIVAAYSTGPVGISDKLDHTNATLIMATCDVDGNLLQPSKPLTPSERMFSEIGQAGDCATCRGDLPQDGSRAQLWSTYSSVGNITAWITVGVGIGADHPSNPADTPLPLSTVDLWPAPEGGWESVRLLHRHWHASCVDGADAVGSGCVHAVAPDLTSTNRSSGTGDLPFDVIVSQATAGDWVVLGELSKFTTLSARRFTSLTVASSGVDMTLSGAAGEEVEVTALHKADEATLQRTEHGDAWRVVVKKATIRPDGTASLSFRAAAGIASTAAGPTAGIRSGVPWFDSEGNLIDAHGAGMLLHDGTYYWYGSRRTINATGTQMDGGIALYSSSDLYNWRFESVVLQPFNCSSNNTRVASEDKTYPPPSCANGNGLDLERPKVVQCGGPGSGGKFVMWVRGTGYGNSPQLLAVLESDHPTGPFTFVSNSSGSDDPFTTIAPGIPNLPVGYQYADATLFTDPKPPHKSYVFWRSRMTKGLDGTTTGFRAMELTEDCRNVVPSSDMRVTETPNREGPAMFHHEDSYYLWVSGTMGWAPTAMYVYKAPLPLGNFSASSMDEHYWHSWSKGDAGANTSTWNGTWTVKSGYLLVGPPFGAHSADGNGGADGLEMSFGAARSLCAKAPLCAGFTFIDYSASPTESTSLMVTFKRTVQLYPEKEVGLQPPPIPAPGHAGNNCSASAEHPCAWAFDSQSTYILPNPHYTAGSKRPSHIYMADRWNYSTALGTSTATYIWLPLFVRPATHASADPAMNPVRVLWRDEWRLDDDSLYPF